MQRIFSRVPFSRHITQHRKVFTTTSSNSLFKTFTTYTMTQDKSKEKTSTLEKYLQISEQLQQQKQALNEQKELVTQLKKEATPDKIKIGNVSAKIKELTEQVNQLTKEWLRADPDKLHLDREEFNELLARRFFVVQSFEIYSSRAAGLFDYGPPACAIKANLLNLWRQHFVLSENMLELDCVSLTPEAVFVASGHVARFADWMVKDESNNECYRADKLIAEYLEHELENPQISADKMKEYEEYLTGLDGLNGAGLGDLIRKLNIKAPETEATLSEPYPFNLMFGTQIGPTGKAVGYLRPETAQGIFVNFKRLLDYNGGKMPFAGATIGQAYRNEIAPRSGLLRVREFTLAEIEHFLNPKDKSHPKYDAVKEVECNFFSAELQNAGKRYQKMTIDQAMQQGIIQNETHAYFIGRTQQFMNEVGILSNGIRFRQHLSNEMAHYASDCWDCEILTSYGWIEVVGIADRSCYDLEAHSEHSGSELVAYETFAEPKSKEVVILKENTKLFGKTLKDLAKPTLAHLQKLSDDEKLKLQQDLANGPVTIKVGEADVKLDSTLISVEKKQEKILGENFVPGVIEPSFGIGRLIYCILEHAYWVRKDENTQEQTQPNKKAPKKDTKDAPPRAVLSLPPVIAPYKTTILPLTNNQVDDKTLAPIIASLSQQLTKEGISHKVDASGQSIGKRYCRSDDLGIPFAITVEQQTVSNDIVTLRERDSCVQIKAKTNLILGVLRDLLNKNLTWEEAVNLYPEQEQTASQKVGKQVTKK